MGKFGGVGGIFICLCVVCSQERTGERKMIVYLHVCVQRDLLRLVCSYLNVTKNPLKKDIHNKSP